MNYKEYENKAITTKAYHEKVAIPYVVLGLCGELGETYEKLDQVDSVEDEKKLLGEISKSETNCGTWQVFGLN